MKENLLKAIADYKDLVFELQKGMTERPAYSPAEVGGVGEWEKALWIEELVRSWGITDIVRMDAPDERVPSGKRPNLIINFKGKTDRKLWIMSHLDVVPPGEEAFWETNPWEAVLDANDPDIIRGRGVEDNQQSIASALVMIKAMIDNNIVPELSLAFMLVADEETHNTYGIDYILNNHECPVDKNDLVLVPDFGSVNDDYIEIAEKSILWLQIIVYGEQCHASQPEAGLNALLVSSEMILRMKDVEQSFTERNDLFQPNRTTIVPTRHDANIPNINTIPGKDVFYIDCRILPTYSHEEVMSRIQAVGDEVAQKYGAKIEVKIESAEPVTKETAPDAEVVQKLKDAIYQVAGIECKLCGAGGGTVAGRLRNLDIPAAVWVSAIPNFHQPNEGSRISYAIRDAQVFASLLF